MADMGDSKSPGEIYAGSSPVFPTRTEKFLFLPIRQAVRHKGGVRSRIKDLVYNGITYDNFLIDEEGNIQNKTTKHIYKKVIHKSGYLVVYLPMGKRGKVKGIRIHKAVAETFIPNPQNYPIVHHKDGDRANPSINNLEWTTAKKNTQYHLNEEKKKTLFYNNRKLTENNVLTIRKYKGIISSREMAKIFGVSKTTIINVIDNKLYREGN